MCGRFIRVQLPAVMLGLMMAPAGHAQDPVEEKPFAESRVVLQLSDQENEASVLDVANNLIRHYGGPDLIDIEIVTFGPGVRLLYAGSKHSERISSLVDNGVRLYICQNTLDMIERDSGARPGVGEHAIPVRAGAAHIIERVDRGFILIKP